MIMEATVKVKENGEQLKINGTNKSHTCNICLKIYQGKKSLRTHNQIVHLGVKVNNCDACAKSFMNESHLRRHKLSHTGEKPLKCDYCNYTTLYNQALNHHTSRVHTKDLPFHCGNCSNKYVSSYLLKKHLPSHLLVKPFKCDKCTKRFSDDRGLKEHYPIHSNVKFSCDECNKTLPTNRRLERHIKTHTNEHKEKLKNDIKYFCLKCKDTNGFRNRSGLSDHDRKHTGEKPFVCDVCNKSFGQSTGLWMHKRTHLAPAEQRPYKCTICESKFTQSGHLSAHITNVHFGVEGEIVCQECGKKSRTNPSHLSHLRTHTGEKPFKCPKENCAYASSGSSGISTHVRFVHLKEKKLKCGICDNFWPTKYSLKIHIKRHKGEKNKICHLCPYKGIKNSDLKSHLQRIHGERSNEEGKSSADEKKGVIGKHKSVYSTFMSKLMTETPETETDIKKSDEIFDGKSEDISDSIANQEIATNKVEGDNVTTGLKFIVERVLGEFSEKKIIMK